MSWLHRLLVIWTAVLIALWSGEAAAHKPSDSLLTIRSEGARLEGRWDLSVRDLDGALDLDANADGAITGRELRTRQDEIARYAIEQLSLASAGSPCSPSVTGNRLAHHSDGAYAVVLFAATCTQPIASLEIDYRLFFEIDPQHRGLLSLTGSGGVRSAVFRTDARVQQFPVHQRARTAQFGAFVVEGTWHIWGGIDHLLFLVALLLPAVLRRSPEGGWLPVAALRPALRDVFRVVTAFTVAHSITLVLATLGAASLPSRWVEIAIALSVAGAALNNLFPVFEGRWGVAFALGLLHGFGFSSVLADLGLEQGSLGLTLLGFNVGVELGQAAVVAAFVPMAYLARATWGYRALLVPVGSVAIVLAGVAWSVQRFLAA